MPSPEPPAAGEAAAAPQPPAQAQAQAERQLIAMHGWAGDGTAWGPWRAATADRPWHWCCGERGYSGLAPRVPAWQGRGRRVVLAHSLGPHLLPAEVLAGAEAVVLLASFARFLPPGREGRALRAALAGMDAALADEPDEPTAAARAQGMLRDFLAKAAAPDPVSLLPPGPGDRPVDAGARRRLRHDLALLGRCGDLPPGFPAAVPVLIVEADSDAIVHPAMGADLRERLPHASLVRCPGAGHALLRAPVIAAVLEWLERVLPD